MRLFIAIDIDEVTKQVIAHSINEVYNKVKPVSWTTPEQWHLTLAFLGEVGKECASCLTKKLESVSETPFTLEVNGIGVFPHWENPRVFWIGFYKNEGLLCLYEKIWDVLQEEGFKREQRDFHPHLTLGRIKKPLSSSEKRYLQTVQVPHQRVTIKAFHLYQSELRPERARYTKLMTYPLKE